MPLVKATLVQAIKDLRNIEVDDSLDFDEHDLFSEALATAIDDYIKSGSVIISGGSSSGTYNIV